MIDATEYLEAAVAFHGHKCPVMPMGLRAGAAAMNRLGVKRARDKELAAVVEIGDKHYARCFADGIQVITCCTYGKGNLRDLSYGKFALTLADRTSGRAVRVALRPGMHGRMKETPHFREFRARKIPPSQTPNAVVEPLIRMVIGMSEEALLSVGEPYAIEGRGRSEAYETFDCDRCGETVVEKYGRIAGGRKVCIPCQETLMSGT